MSVNSEQQCAWRLVNIQSLYPIGVPTTIITFISATPLHPLPRQSTGSTKV